MVTFALFFRFRRRHGGVYISQGMSLDFTCRKFVGVVKPCLLLSFCFAVLLETWGIAV